MKEEFKHLRLPLGEISMNPELGVYYIDMRPAKVHYTENIYDGGFDEDGIPFCGNGANRNYFPINIAQFGFILHAEYLNSKNEDTLSLLGRCVDKLTSLATITDNDCVWWHNYTELKYSIPAPWSSAMAQGEIISLFLRYYQISKEEKYLELSKKAFNFLKNDVSDKGVRRYDQNGDLWFEEYPSNPSSYVLNGFIYTLFGLFDLYRVTGDQNVKEDIDACIVTLKKNLHRFDAGYWSYYDLLKKELVRFYYQKNVHVPQLEALYILTKKEIFAHYANKWKKTVNPINYSFVQVMYRILHRWRKLITKLRK